MRIILFFMHKSSNLGPLDKYSTIELHLQPIILLSETWAAWTQ